MFEGRRFVTGASGKNLYLPKEARYLCLWVAALVLSACFPKAEPQFLLLALIAGIRWAMSGNSRNRNIIILERRQKCAS